MKLHLLSVIAMAVAALTCATTQAQYYQGTNQWTPATANPYGPTQSASFGDQNRAYLNTAAPANTMAPVTTANNSNQAGCDSRCCGTPGCDARCGGAGCDSRGGRGGGRCDLFGCQPAGCDDRSGCGPGGCGAGGCGAGGCGAGGGLGNCGVAGCDGRGGCGVGGNILGGGGGGCDGGCGAGGCGAGGCDSRGGGFGGLGGGACCGLAGCRYVAFMGGWTRTDEFAGGQRLRNTSIFDEQFMEFDEGYGAGIAVGRHFNNCFRGELEFAYRNNPGEYFASDFPLNGTLRNTWDVDGHLESYSFMGNIAYDFRNFCIGRLVPYVGGGVGYGRFVGFFQDVPSGFGDYSITADALVYQAFAGASVAFGQRAELFGEFRYFGSDDLDFDVNNSPAGDFHYDSANVWFGMRVRR